MLWLLLFTSFFANKSRLNIDEVGGRLILAATVSQEFALIQLASEGMPPRIDLLHYDFRRQTFHALEDGRFPSKRPYHLQPHPNGFLLLEKFAGGNAKIHLLDFNGAFKKTLFLNTFHGVQASTNIEQITLFDTDRYWVTLSAAITENQTVPATLDLTQATLKPHWKATDGQRKTNDWWLTFAGTVYRIAPYTGAVATTGAQGELNQKVLANGGAPRSIEDQNKTRIADRHSADFLPYHPVLQTPIVSGRGLILKRTSWLEGTKEVTFMGQTKRVPNRHTDYIVLAGDNLREQSRLMLEKPGFATLAFDQEQGIFTLIPTKDH